MVVAELADVVNELLRNILMHATGPEIGRMQARTASPLIEHHQLFALFKAPKRRRQRAHVHRLRGDVQQVAQDAADLGIQNPDQTGPARYRRAGQPYRRPQGAPPLTMAEMQDSIRTSGEGFIVAAPNVQAQDSVTVDREGTPRSVPSTILLTQAINHATEHRAQITAVLTHLGVEPPSLDGWTYFYSRDS